MLNTNQITSYIYSQRERIENAMSSEYLTSSNDNSRMRVIPSQFVGMPSVEEMIDDIMFNCINGKWAKRGFETENHLNRYIYTSLHRRIKAFSKLYYLNNIPKLTQEEREYWHDFTRDFFNDILTFINQEVKDTSLIPKPQK
ncbi:unnamed protein product, partial [marine sediment metagenome]